MPAARDSRDRSQSVNDYEDSDGDDGGSSKPGRKKNPNSQAARRDQNRIAQREFRLRKQQRIRDLEARVEILSGGKDEALSEMRNMLKDLMQENQTLRNLLRSVSAFIGEGAGGLLPKLGWDMGDFDAFINKSETDTAWEGYQRRKKDGPATAPVSSSSNKRTSEGDAGPSQAKKSKTSNDIAEQQHDHVFPNLLSLNAGPLAAESMYLNPPRNGALGGQFQDMMRNGNGYMQPSPPSSTPASFNHVTSPDMNYQHYMPSVQGTATPALPSVSYPVPPPAETPPQRPTETSRDEDEDEDDPNKAEAFKLIHYHLDNYKRNTAYCLPSSLRPTLVQRTVPHESVIDRILHPDLRDRMILLRGRYDLVDCLLEYRNNVVIHGDDVLNHVNWEIGEKWLRQYAYLVEQPLLDTVNRWRAERGDSTIQLAELMAGKNV